MDLGALFLLLAVLILIVLFVAHPFAGRKRALTESEHKLSALLAERDRLLNTLQELDFDHTLGKIPAEDYPARRAELVRRGAEVLRQIDDFTRDSSPVSGEGETPEDRLEATLAARREAAGGKAGTADVSDEDLEALIARRRSARKAKAAGFCPACGRPVLQPDQFCPQCGHALK